MTRVVRYAERRKWTHLLHAFRAGVERVAKLTAAEEEAADEDVEAAAPAPAPMEAGEAGTSGRGEEGGGRGVGAKSKRKGKGKKGKAAAEAAAEAEEAAAAVSADTKSPAAKKRKRSLPDALVAEWRAFEKELSTAERACGAGASGPVFAFVEGALVTALREGRWILLDEINLAGRFVIKHSTNVESPSPPPPPPPPRPPPLPPPFVCLPPLPPPPPPLPPPPPPSICALTLKVSHSRFECLISMTHLPIYPEGNSFSDLARLLDLNDPTTWRRRRPWSASEACWSRRTAAWCSRSAATAPPLCAIPASASLVRSGYQLSVRRTHVRMGSLPTGILPDTISH